METAPRSARPRSTQGFSLVEVLVAVTIIVIMGGVVAFNVFPEVFRGKRSRAKLDIENLSTAVNMFLTNEGRLPHEHEWPEFLLNGSKNHPEPYIDKDKAVEGRVVDPWDTPYEYKKLSSREFEIVSFAADQQPGGDGDDEDISNKPK